MHRTLPGLFVTAKSSNMAASSLHSNPRIKVALNEAAARGEIGISVAAYYRGKLVVDAFAGLADEEAGRPVEHNTLFAVFSVTKGITALAVHLQAERGLLDLDAPIRL